MPLHIKKAKIPRNHSHVLRSSALESALRDAGIDTEVLLNHVNGTPYFTAYFWPPRPGIPHDRFYLQAGSVPTEQARAAREHIESQVLPAFSAWARNILALQSNSPVRRAEQVFSCNFPLTSA